MKLGEFKSLGTAAAFVALLGGGVSACGSHQEEACKDYFGSKEAKVVDGACLGPDFSTVDELRASCRGEVKKEEVLLCECEGIRGDVWKCVDESDDGDGI